MVRYACTESHRGIFASAGGGGGEADETVLLNRLYV